MTTPLTFAIIIVTVLISYLAFEKRDWFNRLAFHPYVIFQNKEWDRLIGHAFVHADWMHLGFNMYTFYSFGEILEQVLTHPEVLQQFHPAIHLWTPLAGKILFVLIYFLGAVIATLPSLKKYRHQYAYRSVGASGAVSAIMMAFMILFPTMDVGFLMLIPMPAWIGALVFLGLEHYFSKKGQGPIAHDAHIYGALGGILIIGLWDYHFYIDFVVTIQQQIIAFFS
ncbi:MAG: hypothetical protein RL062_780 [Bacteroidota bacterium]